MRNKHPGLCYKCGKLVMEGAGFFEKTPKNWRVQHDYCKNVKIGSDPLKTTNHEPTK